MYTHGLDAICKQQTSQKHTAIPHVPARHKYSMAFLTKNKTECVKKQNSGSEFNDLSTEFAEVGLIPDLAKMQNFCKLQNLPKK